MSLHMPLSTTSSAVILSCQIIDLCTILLSFLCNIIPHCCRVFLGSELLCLGSFGLFSLVSCQSAGNDRCYSTVSSGFDVGVCWHVMRCWRRRKKIKKKE